MRTEPRRRTVREHWREVEALSRACDEAKDLPSRIRALCEYQGALAVFFREHEAYLTDAIERAPRWV